MGRLNGIFSANWRVQFARSKVWDHSTRWDMRLRFLKEKNWFY